MLASKHSQLEGSASLKGPKGQKRPADVIGNAIKVARIAMVRNRGQPGPDRQVAWKPGREGAGEGANTEAARRNCTHRRASPLGEEALSSLFLGIISYLDIVLYLF